MSDEELLRRWRRWTEKKNRLESIKYLNRESEKRRLNQIKTCEKQIDKINEELRR